MSTGKMIVRTIMAALGFLTVAALIFYWRNLRGVGPVLFGPPEDITEILNTTGMPLTLPNDVSIGIFAKDIPGARVLAFDSFGNLWVSQTEAGTISLLEIGDDGTVRNAGTVLQNLRRPHGLAFNPANPFQLFYAEEHALSWLPTYSDGGPEKIADLPSGDGHVTRSLGFGPDGRLYVSVGSSCNVCHEADDRRAKIITFEIPGPVTDGPPRPPSGEFQEFARGLRNAVFFAWHPQTGELWATEMGRDLLGDNLPPDEINIIREGGSYGWPICYGKNIHDTDFDKNTYIRNPCMEPFEAGSFIDIPAHSAPLGLAFIGESDTWPKEYWHNLIVAYHGSWNRSEPTGYKLVRFKLDKNGAYLGTEDFVTGWLRADGALGRPVDVKIGPDGALYVSDDKAGVVYRIAPR